MWLIVRSMNFFLQKKFKNWLITIVFVERVWRLHEDRERPLFFIFYFPLVCLDFWSMHMHYFYFIFKYQQTLSGWYTHATWLFSLVSSNIFKVFVSLKINYITKKHTVLQYSKYWNLSKIVLLRIWRPHAYYLLLKGHLGLSDSHSLPFIFLECMPGIHNLQQS